MSPPHDGASASRMSGFWLHLGLGLLVTFLLVGAKVCFEHTTRGHHMEQWTYGLPLHPKVEGWFEKIMHSRRGRKLKADSETDS